MEIRTTKPSNNKFYITKSVGGFSTCIVGKPTDPTANVLANCVGYACGRFNEIIGEMKYPQLNCNAGDFITRAKSLGLSISDKPTLGGIIVWQGNGAGHVAVVERIDNDNQIYTSESCYNGRTFYNAIRKNDNGRWGQNSKYTYIGCIINPNIQPTPTYKYKLGDVVNINGVYTNSNSTNKLIPAIKTGTITLIKENVLNPYLLNNGDIGWVNDDCITGIYTPTEKIYKVGDVVRINGVYTSSTSTVKLVPAVKQGTITKILTNGARNPYLLNNGDIGWINDDCII